MSAFPSLWVVRRFPDPVLVRFSIRRDLSGGNVTHSFSSLTYGSGQDNFALAPLLGYPLAKRILLADDSVTAQNMGKKILHDAGYEVVTVNNGSAALKRIAELHPELIVLDVYMPGYSGLEVCQRIKEAQETAAIPVLLTVGKLEPFKADEAKRVHADAFIVKPFEATELLTILTKLEDKIAPAAKASQSRAPSTTRPAKSASRQPAPAAVKSEPKSEKKSEKYSEPEAGWKERLRIQPTATVEEPATMAPPSSAFHDLRSPVSAASPAAQEQPTFEVTLPPDITAEELAAISEAAASLSEQPEAYAPSILPEQEQAVAFTIDAPQTERYGVVAAEPVTTFAGVPAFESAAPEVDTGHFEAAAEITQVQQEAAEAVAEETHGAVEEIAALVEEQTTAGAEVEAAPEELLAQQISPAAEEEVPAAITAEAAEAAAPEPPAVRETQPADGRLSEAEVADALASLAPLESLNPYSGIIRPEAYAADTAGNGLEASSHAGTLVENLYASKWIAEEVPVDESVSALILEQEMNRAYSAIAPREPESATAAALEPAYVYESPTAIESIAAPELGVTAAPVEEISYAATLDAVTEQAGEDSAYVPAEHYAGVEAQAERSLADASDYVAAIHEEAAQFAAPVEAVAEAAEVEPAATPEPAEEIPAGGPFEPTLEAEAVVETAVVAEEQDREVVSPEPVAASGEESPAGEAQGVEVQAAVAEAADSPAAAVATAEPPASETAIDPDHAFPPAHHRDEDEQPPDVAAAWARWRQIRDSLASPEFTAHVADAAAAQLAAAAEAREEAPAAPEAHSAADFKDIRQEQPRAPQPEEPTPQVKAAAASADSAIISSIVENVLAELKPKLVEEIARKLGSKS